MELLQNLGGFHGDHYTGPVVDGAGAEIPRIEMAGNDHDLLRMFTALEVGDDVVAGDVGKLLRSEGEVDADFALCGQVRDEVGVFGGDGSGGNAGRITESGMGQAEIGAADGANREATAPMSAAALAPEPR